MPASRMVIVCDVREVNPKEAKGDSLGCFKKQLPTDRVKKQGPKVLRNTLTKSARKETRKCLRKELPKPELRPDLRQLFLWTQQAGEVHVAGRCSGRKTGDRSQPQAKRGQPPINGLVGRTDRVNQEIAVGNHAVTPGQAMADLCEGPAARLLDRQRLRTHRTGAGRQGLP